MPSFSDILNAIADEKAFKLLNTIATTDYESEDLVRVVNLSRKEFYSRVSRFIDTGLVKRRGGKYSMTLFGRLVHEVEIVIEDALRSHWKLKALEEIETFSELPPGERENIIDSLVDNEFIKRIYLQAHETSPRAQVKSGTQ